MSPSVPVGASPPPGPARTSRRNVFRIVFWVLVVVAVVVALLYRSRGAIGLEGFSWERLADSLRSARLPLLLLSLVAIYVSYALRAQRWVRFCRYVGPATFADVYAATLVGFTAVFLFGRAGEPIRPLLIARKSGAPVSSAFGIYVLERVFDGASTAALLILGLLVFPDVMLGSGELASKARALGVVLLGGLFIAIFFLVYLRVHGSAALERKLDAWRAPGHAPGWRPRVAGLISGFSEGLQAIRTPGDLVAAVFYSVAHWVVVALIYVWVAHSFPGSLAGLGFPAAMLVLGFTMVGSTVQLPGIGGGSQLGSFLAFTVVFGVEKEPAAAASVVLWLITFAGCCLAGVPLLIREGWSMGELRRLARAEAEAEAAGTHVAIEKKV